MKTKILGTLLVSFFLLMSCSNDDDNSGVDYMGDTKVYSLMSVSNPSISGTAKFIMNKDNSTTIELKLNGTSNGMHPAHIHFNTAAEGGGIAVSLNSVDGSTGMSTTSFNALDDGTSVTYDDMIDFNGYINVHLSSDDLTTLVAQGDIGQNELTDDMKMYDLGSVSDPDISGMAVFTKRVNGTTLVTLDLMNTPTGGVHPSHIHFNTAAEGGDVAISLSSVNGDNGKSMTQVGMLNDGTAITYEELLSYDGYINVHASVDDLATLVAQGDIGQNELTGDEKVYDLASVSNPAISGTATFKKRVNGTALVALMLMGTPADGVHPSHIHFNTAAEGGDVAISLSSVNGESGMSMTQVGMLNDGTAITYEELLNFDGYINVHVSADDLATLVAQGDIGQNELTGDEKTYDLGSVSDPAISGTATFKRRMNGNTLVELMLMGTPMDGMHPSHIHFNTAAEGGDIAVSLNAVDGNTGMSKTSVEMLNDGMAITYDDLLDFDGYINVHASADDLATLVAQGDIGQNELSGESMNYNLGSISDPSISGEAIFYQRVNGEALLMIALEGTTAGNTHPSHIHMGSVDNPGDIAISLTPVDGATGVSKTNISMLDAGDAFLYEDVLGYNGYINVHLSSNDLATLVAQGNIGANN